MKTLSALIIAALLLASCSDSGDPFEFTFSTDECGGGRIPTSHVMAVDTETGSELWSQRVPYGPESSNLFQLVDDRLVFTFSTANPSYEVGAVWFGGIAALSTAGEPLWQEVVGPTGRAAVTDGLAVMLVRPSVGLASERGIDISDGREVWSNPSDGLWFDLLGGPVTLFGEDNTIRAVEAATGSEVWSYSSDGISSWGSLSTDGRAVVPVGELARYIDVELETGEAMEINTASGGGAVRVIALTPDVIVGHEEWWATDDAGKRIAVNGLFGYDRDSWQEVWHREVANAWGSVWVGDFIVKPGRNIRVYDIATGAEVARIPAGHRDQFEFAAPHQEGVLIGYDGVIVFYAEGELTEVLIGAATQGAWEVDDFRTLVASTSLAGRHQVAMMDDELRVTMWSAELDQPVDHIVLGDDAAYVVVSDASCSNF